MASIHLSQMLYIWPFIAFFSWPLLLPQILNRSPKAPLARRLPRWWIAVTTILAMAVVVHFNTIVHPFTLADNRHYVFYVFRILLRHPLIKYAATPVYFVCAWLTLNALAGIPRSPRSRTPDTGSCDVDNPPPVSEGQRVSFLLVWLTSSALSLVSAPLVEPRYFIVPWLIWRIHVPEVALQQDDDDNEQKPISSIGSASKPQNKGTGVVRSKGNSVTREKRTRSPHPSVPAHAARLISFLSSPHVVLSLELAWFAVLNYLTCRLFLHNSFTWPQEPGKVQRFMW